ncbi:hypothetical protein [Kaarinaea lacus]
MFRYINTTITYDVKYEAVVYLEFGSNLKEAVSSTKEFLISEKTHGFFGELDIPQQETKKYERSPSDYYHYGKADNFDYHHDFANWGGVGGAESYIDLSLKIREKIVSFHGLSGLTAYPYYENISGVEIQYQKKKFFDEMYIDYEDARKKLTELGWVSRRMTLNEWNDSLVKKNNEFIGRIFESTLYQYTDDNYKVVITMLYYREHDYGYINLDIYKNINK